jgi:hypothetical protein
MSLPASDLADDRQADVIIALVISLTAAYVAVVLRFIARRIAGAGLRADDYMILIGLVSIQSHISIPTLYSWHLRS